MSAQPSAPAPGARAYMAKHDNTTGRPFRLVCRRALHLADQLSQRLLLTRPGGTSCCALQSAQAALLARQEGVIDLRLQEGEQLVEELDATEVFILKTLLMGGTPCRRLHILHIASPSSTTCTDAVGEAIKLCCPRLHELELTVNMPGPSDGFFKPLGECAALAKVTINGNAANFQLACVLRGLAALPSLRAVCLKGRLDYTDLALLTALTGVHELRAEWLTVFASAPGKDALLAARTLGCALGGMTQLTALEVPRCAGGTVESMNAVVAQLGGLRGLTALVFGSTTTFAFTFPVAFHALSQLTGLIRLTCPASCQERAAVGGCLPRLQQVRVLGAIAAADLCATLRPLLPLSQLRLFECTVRADSHSTDAQVAAVAQIAAALSKGSCLEQVKLTIGQPGTERSSLGTSFSLALVTPLRDVLTSLHMDWLPDEAVSSLLDVVLGARRLEVLSMRGACVTPRVLLAVARNLPALRELDLRGCEAVATHWMVALAQLRVQPLHIKGGPAFKAAHRAFSAVAREGVTLET